MSWLYSRPTEGTIAFLERKFAKQPEIAAANVKAFRAGYAFGETTEEFAVQYEVRPAKLAPGHLPQRHRQPGARDGPRRRERAERAAALPRRLPDHARLRDPGGAGAAQELRRADLPGRGRDRRRRRRARRLLRRRARGLDVERPGRRPQGRDGRARGHARAARSSSSTSSAPGPPPGCRRSRSRPICSWSCSGGTPSRRCRCWPPRRPATASRWRSRPPASPSSTARPCISSRTPTSPTAPSRGSSRTSPTCRTSRPEFATEPNDGDRFLPYVRDDRTLAREWALPGTPGPRAPDRRAGEGGAHRQHLLRPRQPRPDGPAAGAEGRGDRRRHPRADRRPPGGREPARARLGRHARADRRRRPPRARAGRARSRTRTSPT